MKHFWVLFILLVILSNSLYSQYLHLGLQFSHTEQSFDFNKETYYISNSRNSNITALDIETGIDNPFQTLIPALYIKHQSKNNFYSEYLISAFIQDIEVENKYSDMFHSYPAYITTFSMYYLSQTFIAGYKLRNTKLIKPFIYTGLSSKFYLAKEDFWETGYIFTAIRPITFYFQIGTGLAFFGFTKRNRSHCYFIFRRWRIFF